jgi:hypothetical protein
MDLSRYGVRFGTQGQTLNLKLIKFQLFTGFVILKYEDSPRCGIHVSCVMSRLNCFINST